MTTKTSKPKKYKKRKTKLSYGPRGLETLRLCFQVGGMTPQQHARFFATNIRNSYRLLSSLSDQRLLESAPVQTGGRPRDFCFLGKANASRGVVLGGHEAGMGESRAKENYRFHGLPQNVEHSHMRNEFYLSLLEASREESSVADVRLWDMWGEFPLRGTKRGEKTFPDGVFDVRYGEDLAARYLVEYESRSRPGEVLRKLDAYGAHFSRCLKEDKDSIEGWLRPVIFLFSQSSTATHVMKRVADAEAKKESTLSRYLAWREAATKSNIVAGRLVLFASLETLEARGALSLEYTPLTGYLPEDEGVGDDVVVDLETVADEVAEVLSPDEEKE